MYFIYVAAFRAIYLQLYPFPSRLHSTLPLSSPRITSPRLFFVFGEAIGFAGGGTMLRLT